MCLCIPRFLAAARLPWSLGNRTAILGSRVVQPSDGILAAKLKFWSSEMTEDDQSEVFVVMPFGNHDEYRDGSKEANFVFKRIIKPGRTCLPSRAW